MSEEVREELLKGGVVDITTKGRRTGESRRIEIRIHNVDGEIYLTGQPGPRGWHANLLATPDFRLHLKRELVADLDAHATAVTGDEEKRRVHRAILENIGRIEQLDDRMKSSPLLHIAVSTD